MAVRVYIHSPYRQFTNGLESVTVEGKTVGECLADLINAYPGMEQALFQKKDRLRNYVEIYVNQASAYPNELAKPVKDDDEIVLTCMIAGG